MEYPFSLQRFLRKLENYLTATGDDSVIYTFMMAREKVRYGMKIYPEIVNHLENLLKGQLTINYRVIHLYLVLKTNLHPFNLFEQLGIITPVVKHI